MATGTFHRIGGLALLLSLSACGGEGSGVGSTPNPPSGGYTKISEITGKRTFNSSSIVEISAPGSIVPVFGPATEFGEGVKISYDATAGSYTLEAGGRTQTFESSDAIASMGPVLGPNPQLARYGKADGSNLTIITPNPGGVDLSYTRLATWTNIADIPRPYLLVYGMPTASRDMPRSGSATYSKLQVRGAIVSTPGAIRQLTDASASFSADFGASTVQTSIEVPPVLSPVFVGNPPSGNATLTGSGVIAAGSSSFDGTISGLSMSGLSMSGRFAGSFFGPQAAEFGYVFSMSGGDGLSAVSAIGSVVGAK